MLIFLHFYIVETNKVNEIVVIDVTWIVICSIKMGQKYLQIIIKMLKYYFLLGSKQKRIKDNWNLPPNSNVLGTSRLKEMNFCHKLQFCNPFISATRRPYVKLWNLLDQIA